MISADMKKVWAVQLHILSEIQKICNKHSITYSVSRGTLLGAIRHKGFIPWDDDVDICMPRKDYNRFLSVASKELPDGLFLQTPLTDPEYDLGFAKVRDSQTSALEAKWVNAGCRLNMGIFVDVFPVDRCLSHRVAKIQMRIAGLLSAIRRKRYQRVRRSFPDYLKSGVGRMLFVALGGSRGVYWLQEKLLSLFKLTPTSACAVFGFFKADGSYPYWPVNWFTETVSVPFEFLQVNAPRDYAEVLDYTYGDWHQFLKGRADHLFRYLSADIPYREALEKGLGN